jgi:hypothetical protein
MKIDERFGGHIPIKMLWEIRTKVRVLTDEESAHFLGCNRCMVAFAICRLSQSLEEAQTRLEDHLAAD